MSTDSFLAQHFKGITLAPALFYACENGIRFEIANPGIPYGHPDDLKQAFYRSIVLFDEVFGTKDELLVVTDVTTSSNNRYLQQKPLNVYRKYMKQKRPLYTLRHEMFSGAFDDEEDMSIHRFSLLCQKRDFRYQALLRAICHEDYIHPSRILKNDQQSGYEIYFLNLTKGLIYHLYDDRGCDILVSNKESIRFLYEVYSEWILDYDREEIMKSFDEVKEIEF